MTDAPAYCMICDRPILVGPICDPCAEHFDAHDQEESDDDTPRPTD